MKLQRSRLHAATGLFLLGLGASAPVFAAPADPVSAQQQADLQQQLIAADRALYHVTAGPHPDVETYQSMLAPDFIDVEFGAVHPRDEDIAQVKLMRDFTFDYQNPRAVVLSPTSGYVLADVRYSGVVNGGGIQNHVLSITLFSLEHGKWLAHAQTSQPSTASSKPAAAVPDNDPTLVALRALAAQVEAQVHIAGYPAFPVPKVMLDAGTSVSYSSPGAQAVHTAQFADLPAPMQGIWNQWATYTTDQPSGKALFDDMFHRFFFVHELGHGIADRVIGGLPGSESSVVAKNQAGNKWEAEMVPNRIAVAWYREHDPQYLAKLVKDFHDIEAHLPNPVPAGMDKKTYFTDNYQTLGQNPLAYGWYQLQMVMVAYAEPARSFQQVLDALPKDRSE